MRGRDLSDVSVYGTDLGFLIREDFRFIVESEGNEDEAEIHEFERRCRDAGTGHPAQDAQAIFG